MIKILDSFASFITFAITIFVLCCVGLFYWVSQQYLVSGDLDKSIVFEVQRNQRASDIAESLEKQGLISNARIFVYAMRITGQDRKIKAGEFAIPAHASMKQISEILTSGQPIQRLVMIPEGLTSYQIVQILGTVENLSGTISNDVPEGSLLPDSYDYRKNEASSALISRMTIAMANKLRSLCGISDDIGFDDILTQPCTHPVLKATSEVVTLASIVEKETGVPEERARVAGLFLNRLQKNMLLQTDPTVIYALTKGRPDNNGKGPLGRRLLRKDLKIDSPYNTYLYTGLPPGPICNPGRASLEAVFAPENHDYIYMVADGTGGHAFAKTLAEHNDNVAKWRKVRAAQ